jgi:hypothetical protein
MKILISGNPKFGIASELSQAFDGHELMFSSREAGGHDLTRSDDQKQFAVMATHADVAIINSALWKFNQTVLLDTVYKACVQKKVKNHIVCIGSTTDRVKKGGAWLYNAEKKALRDYCNTLGLNGVWDGGPKVTLISFGTLSNNQEKHPNRKCMEISQAVEYVKWVINQPPGIHINELSVDPLQNP